MKPYGQRRLKHLMSPDRADLAELGAPSRWAKLHSRHRRAVRRLDAKRARRLELAGRDD